jgi:hypothetical protein
VPVQPTERTLNGDQRPERQQTARNAPASCLPDRWSELDHSSVAGILKEVAE